MPRKYSKKQNVGDREKIINKKEEKLIAGCCRICGNDIYAVLDVHRIVPGEDNGKYTRSNTVTICSNCHRLIHHDKKITIDRWYYSTAGYLLRIIENGVERFI